MRKVTTITLAAICVALSALPWLLSGCASQPLIPEALLEERIRYTETVAAARAATSDAMRSATSSRKVVPLGTVATGEGPAIVTVLPQPTEGRSSPSPASAADSQPSEIATAAVTASAIPTPISSSGITVYTVVVPSTVTMVVKTVVVRSEPSPVLSPETPTATAPVATETATVTPAPPTQPVAMTPQEAIAGSSSAMVEVEDVIGEQALTDTIKELEGADTLSDLALVISPHGVVAVASATIFPGISRPIEVTGEFAVENDSLVVKVSSVLLDGADVSERYRWQIETSVNSSLYRLLPERHVQSFEVLNGSVHVRSLMKRQN